VDHDLVHEAGGDVLAADVGSAHDRHDLVAAPAFDGRR
jgi:hypothetical protein